MYCLDVHGLVGKIIYGFELIKPLLREIRVLFNAQPQSCPDFCGYTQLKADSVLCCLI